LCSPRDAGLLEYMMRADNDITTAEKVSKVWGVARRGLDEVGDHADSAQYATCMSKSYTSAVT